MANPAVDPKFIEIPETEVEKAREARHTLLRNCRSHDDDLMIVSLMGKKLPRRISERR